MHEVDKYLATLSSDEIPRQSAIMTNTPKWQELMDNMSDGDSVEMTKREYNSFYQAARKQGYVLRWRTTQHKTKQLSPSGAKFYCNESLGRAYLYKNPELIRV